MLGPEADRVDALAAMHGVVASAALAIGKRIISHGGSRHVMRQGRALGRLAVELANAFERRGANLDDDTVARIVSLLSAAAQAERRGVRYDQLVVIPPGWPAPGLAITPRALALCAAMRLRQALERHALACADPRRVAQLQAIKGLESQILGLHRDLAADKITTGNALRSVIERFAAVEPVIGADLAELLGGDAPR